MKTEKSITERIKTYEDACIALGEPMHEHSGLKKDETAYLMLKTISRALWGRNFKPVPDANGDKAYYYPCFALFAKSEIDEMSSADMGRKALLVRNTYNGEYVGFDGLHIFGRSSYSLAFPGFQLCQETPEKAKYFGKQFIELWADYLLFDI